jgi:hypothetical protein
MRQETQSTLLTFSLSVAPGSETPAEHRRTGRKEADRLALIRCEQRGQREKTRRKGSCQSRKDGKKRKREKEEEERTREWSVGLFGRWIWRAVEQGSQAAAGGF